MKGGGAEDCAVDMRDTATCDIFFARILTRLAESHIPRHRLAKSHDEPRAFRELRARISMADGEEELCRYCFEGEDDEAGELLRDICACTGGQRCVHLSCLRRWQRMVLVSQPTHPAFYQDDERHHKCNVCASPFNIPPPTRHELMASFTGAEIAALISEGCVIGSHRDFDTQLSRQLRTMDPLRRLISGYKHWIGGVYLITSVIPDEGELEVPMRNENILDAIRGKILATSDLSLDVGGRRVKLMPKGDLARVTVADRSDEKNQVENNRRLRLALEKLKAPATIFMATGDAPDYGADHVVAVNLTRRILPPKTVVDEGDEDEPRQPEAETNAPPSETNAPPSETTSRPVAENEWSDSEFSDAEDAGHFLETVMSDVSSGVGSIGDRPGARWWRQADAAVREAKEAVAVKYPGARDVEVEHFRGGPCESDRITTLVVPGGARRGWTVVSAKRAKKRESGDFTHRFEPVDRFGGGLCEAIELAHSRAVSHPEHDGKDGDVRGGQTVVLKNLTGKPELNGEKAIAGRFEPESGRWLLRLRNGEGARVKPENLEPMEGARGRVFAFWGDARWSRAQLLGEIARGHWGLCRGSTADIASRASERRAALDGRLAFAPTTEMTEEWMRRAAADMSSYRDMGVAAEGDDDAVGRD